MLKTKKIIREQLASIYPPSEVESLVRLILEHVTGYNRLQMHLNQTAVLPDSKIMQITEILNRMGSNEPIQYILGETQFFGLNFKVTPAVLIPRAETEELVDWIITDEGDRSQSLLDIGTGSGCIPVAIDKNTRMTRVEGWDISEKALEVARLNATRNGSKVQFGKQDIFNPTGMAELPKWDVIVSNPPYVLNEEAGLMAKNVLDFEPHLALFVPDNDPLLFYRTIAQFAKMHLSQQGRLYFEINERMGEAMATLLQEYGFNEILTRKDLQGKVRMIRGSFQGHS